MLSRITNWLILTFLFLLPWQTRWIYGLAELNGHSWEYGTLSFYGTEILLWLIVILTGVRLFGNKNFREKIISRSHLLRRWPALVLGVAIAILIAYFYSASPEKEISAQFISRLLGSICLMICLVVSNLNFKQMSLAFWSSATLQGYLAVLQFFVQETAPSKWLGIASHRSFDTGVAVVQTESERWLRAYGAFGWPNTLGVYLALALLIGFIIYKYVKPRYRPFFLIGQMIIGAGIMFSFSRNAIVAMIAGSIVYFIVVKIKKMSGEVKPVIEQLVAVFAVALVISAFYCSAYYVRIAGHGVFENISRDARLEQYRQNALILNQNIFMGVGPGLYTYAMAGYFSPPAFGSYEPVHNIYLLSLTELGLIGYIILNTLVIFLVFQIWKKRPLFLGVIFALFVAGIFDHFLWSLYIGQALFWVIFGLGLAKDESVDGLPLERT